MGNYEGKENNQGSEETINDKFQRWQSILREHLTFNLNLFFGISGAALVFTATLIKDEEFILLGISKFAYQLSLLTLSIAVIINGIAEISRLLDFRYTFWKVKADKYHYKDEFKDGEKARIYKSKKDFYGKLTWWLFWMQFLFLVPGLLGMAISFISAYSTKIW